MLESRKLKEKEKQMLVRKMKLQDVAEVAEIEKECFITPWSRQSFEAEIIKNKFARYLVGLDDDNQVCVYMGYWKIMDEGHITNIAVKEKHRGKGYAKQIIKDIIQLAKSENVKVLTLEVRQSNLPAINLYQSFGFVEIGIRKQYYIDTKEDAILMLLSLEN